MTTEFQASKKPAERPFTQEEYTLRIFDNPKWSGIVLSVDHNNVGAADVRVDIYTAGGARVKGWSFKGSDRKRKYRARLIDGCIELRARAALTFCEEIEHELLRGRAVFVTLYLEHANAGARVRFPIDDRGPETLVRHRDVLNSGVHGGGAVVE